MEKFDVVIVGGGIVGLAHALAASRRVERVLVLERSTRAFGASVRNFGMGWPIGQPHGPLLQRALRSRDIWLECAASGLFTIERCGALHVAMHQDEMDVLAEFNERHAASYGCRLLTGGQACAQSPALRRDTVIGALQSDAELCVDPREAVVGVTRMLQGRGVQVRFEEHVRGVSGGRVELANGTSIGAERVIVCSGADTRTLYPDVLARAGLAACKLQMMRTVAQPDGWRVGAHLAAGLTLLHYKAFAECASLAAVRKRFTEQAPAYLAAGVHVLVSQNAAGEITLGDSHEYSPDPDPFDKPAIDQLVIDYLAQFFRCPTLTIAQRWHGVYAKSTTGAAEFVERVDPGVYVVTGLGGAGMTLSFGLAEETTEAVLGDRAWRPA